jgi:two-component system chemotaxis response regulator CheB
MIARIMAQHSGGTGEGGKRKGVQRRDIIVVGGSAGGVEAISRLVGKLPRDFPASVFVTLHFPAQGISVLPRILARAGSMPAEHPTDGETVEHGRIYVAPPDRHLILQPGHVRLVRGPTENGNRPAIDAMFRAAAVAYGPRVIGVVLTGNLDDGTAGLRAIKRRGGLVVVQSPDDALFTSMPLSAVHNARPNYVLPLDEIPLLLERLVREGAPEPPARADERDAKENAYSSFDLPTIEHSGEHPGRPSGYGCPDCGGVLWEIKDGELTRFRCRVGHGWTADALMDRQGIPGKRALERVAGSGGERVALSDQMAERLERRGIHERALRYRDSATKGAQRAEVIRRAIATTVPPVTTAEPEPAEDSGVVDEPATNRSENAKAE